MTQFTKYFIKMYTVHNYNTRSSNKCKFAISYNRTVLRSMSISVRGAKMWNEFDLENCQNKSITTFKKCIKQKFLGYYTCM